MSRAYSTQLTIKRLLDLLVASLGTTACLPLLAAISLAIVIDSGRPVFYVPQRVGRNFTSFGQYKFRTMVKDAQSQLPQLAHLNAAQGMIKIPNDPRVTRVGRWLRRYSLDELPQLFNVIKGDMSLVGPRPYAADEVSASNPEDRERLLMRPGLTGLWQVSARSDPSISKRFAQDLAYVRDYSLSLDMRIVLGTLPAILSGRGGEVLPNSGDGDSDPVITDK